MRAKPQSHYCPRFYCIPRDANSRVVKKAIRNKTKDFYIHILVDVKKAIVA